MLSIQSGKYVMTGKVDKRQAFSYLDWTTGLLHFLINIEELSCKLVHLDGILEGVSQELIVMRHLSQKQEKCGTLL